MLEGMDFLKVDRSIGKGSLQASEGPRRKAHSAQPQATGRPDPERRLNLMSDLTVGDVDRASLSAVLPFVHERVTFKIPSDIKFLDGVLDYLNERMLKLGLVEEDESHLLIALDEAIINAIKHGNKSDNRKAVHIVAELSPREACFTVTDEGVGFVREDVPDPTAPTRLLEPSGRGLLLINHIMDEVCYNKCGNEIRMVKRLSRTQPEHDDPAGRP